MFSRNVSIKVTEFYLGGYSTIKRPMIIGIVILVVYVVIICANTVNIVLIVYDKRLHKPMYLLICHLAVVDIIYTSSVTPTVIGALLIGFKTISYHGCLAQMYIFTMSNILVMFALSIMAFDRLVAIGYPLQYHSFLSNTRLLVLTCVFWVVAVIFVIHMPVSVVSLPHCHSRLIYHFCDYAAVIRTTCVDLSFYFNVVTIISFFLIFFTLTFISLSYLMIVHFAKLASIDDRKKMALTCVSHLIVVVCFFTPIFVRIVLTRMGVNLNVEERQSLIVGAILGPSIVNPFIYCLGTKEIKNKIIRMFRQPKILV